MRLLLAASAVLLLAATSVAHAGCDDLVVDDAHLINDVGKVTAAARKLSNAGADVRVYTVRSLKSAGVANLDEYELKMQKQCPSWQSNGHRKSTLLVIMIHPAKYTDNSYKVPTEMDAGVYYGAEHTTKFQPVWTKVQSNALQPAISAYRNGEKDAYTRAFVSMLGDYEAVLNTSFTTGPTTIVRQEAGDSSWFGRMVIGVVLIVAACGVVVFFVRKREDGGEAKTVQAETRRVRSGCLNRLLVITSPDKIAQLDALIAGSKNRLSTEDSLALTTAYTTFVQQGKDALAAFGRFDSTEKDDPNVSGLTASAYRSNQQAYEDIIAGSIEPAEASLATINELLSKAHQARAA